MTDEEINLRFDVVEKRQYDLEARQNDLDKLVTSVALIANEQEHMRNDVTEIKADVKALTNLPANRWNELIRLVVAGIVGAFLLWLGTGMPGI